MFFLGINGQRNYGIFLEFMEAQKYTFYLFCRARLKELIKYDRTQSNYKSFRYSHVNPRK